eukprot:g9742.t1
MKERVVRADFSGTTRIDPLDEAYVLRLFERPDVTVVINGLATGLDPDLWNTRFLAERCGEIMYHSFRRFVKLDGDAEETFTPIPEREKAWSSMRLRDFVRYLDKRANALRTRAAGAAATTGNTSAAAAATAGTPHGGSNDGAQERIPAGGDYSGGGDRDSGARRPRGGDTETGEGETAGRAAGGGGSKQQQQQQQQQQGKEEVEPCIQFVSYDGGRRTVELLRESVYLTDMDLTRYLPECANDLSRQFKMDILPAGARCAMQHMPRESRPFLGPNLYITPPGSWTQFHQDGNGTVDSGHQCLAGRNRVIMLRRLDNEEDKHTALKILSEGGGGRGQGQGRSAGAGSSKVGINGNGISSADSAGSHHDARGDLQERYGGAMADDGGVEGETGGADSPLYRPPHSDGTTPPWPSDEAVERLRELNFCPSVFTLEPGEFVHINKGRLHAFRKEQPLPGEDPGSVCVSVAWDWVFNGVTEEGCKEEMGCALRCANDNRRAGVNSLAPVETCLLQMAKASLARYRVRSLQQRQPDPVPHQLPLPDIAPPPPSSPPPVASGASRRAAAGDMPPSTLAEDPAAIDAPSGEQGLQGGTAGENALVAVAAAAPTAAVEPPVKSAGLASSTTAGEEKQGAATPSSSSCPENGASAGQDGKPWRSSPAVSARERKRHHPPPPPPQSQHAANLELISRLMALVPEGALGPHLTDALRAIDTTPDPLRGSPTRNGSPRAVDSGSSSANGSSNGGASAAEANGGAGGGSGAAMEVDKEDEEIRSGALPQIGRGKVGMKKGEDGTAGVVAATTASADSGNGESPASLSSSPKASTSTSSPISTSLRKPCSSSSGGGVPGYGSRQQAAPADNSTAIPPAIVVTASSDSTHETNLHNTEPDAMAIVPIPPPLTGLGTWIASPRGFDPLALDAGVGGDGTEAGLLSRAVVTPTTDSELMALVAASAKETLESTAPATAAAEAAAAREGGGPASVAFAAAAARSAVASARLAAAAAATAMRRVTESLVGVGAGGGSDCGGEAAAVLGMGASGGDLGALVALAPMLEELTDRQRRDYGLQAAAKQAKRVATVAVNPHRPGRRKLGTAAAKARDAQTAALMAKMVRPLKKAVERVEVDTSVPSFKEKINPFSSDGESFNCASCKVDIFNAYMHCYGCETILNRDLTLCLGCHAAGRFAFPPDPHDARLLSDRIHCPGEPERTLDQRERKARSQRSHGVYPASRCECKERSCRQCHLCVACACDCHERYQLRFRFEHPSSLESFVKKVRVTAGGPTTISQEAPTNPPEGTGTAAAGREDGDGDGDEDEDRERAPSSIQVSSSGAVSSVDSGSGSVDGSGADNGREGDNRRSDTGLYFRQHQLYRRRVEPLRTVPEPGVEANGGDVKKAPGDRLPSSRKRKASEEAAAAAGGAGGAYGGRAGWGRSKFDENVSEDGGNCRNRDGGGANSGGGQDGARSARPSPADAAAPAPSFYGVPANTGKPSQTPSNFKGGPAGNNVNGNGNSDVGASFTPPLKRRRETPSNGMGSTAAGRTSAPDDSGTSPSTTGVALKSSDMTPVVMPAGGAADFENNEWVVMEDHVDADAPDWDGEDDADTVLL